jgi:transposase InsO family protein
MIGVLVDGNKEVIAIEDGYRKSTESWASMLRDLKRRGLRAPVLVIGDCYDNAVMESFFGMLKTECASERYPTRADARTDIFEYVEVWCNQQRRHSTLGYLSPHAFEMAYALDKVVCPLKWGKLSSM